LSLGTEKRIRGCVSFVNYFISLVPGEGSNEVPVLILHKLLKNIDARNEKKRRIWAVQVRIRYTDFWPTMGLAKCVDLPEGVIS
jgi:hypothetical protein